jgi:hypothetical protein
MMSKEPRGKAGVMSTSPDTGDSAWLKSLPPDLRAEVKAELDGYSERLDAALADYFKDELAAKSAHKFDPGEKRDPAGKWSKTGGCDKQKTDWRKWANNKNRKEWLASKTGQAYMKTHEAIRAKAEEVGLRLKPTTFKAHRLRPPAWNDSFGYPVERVSEVAQAKARKE